MVGKCRDCSRCTEAVAVGFVMGIFRKTWALLTFWNIGLFIKKCPQCRHRLSLHARRADGSFRD